MNSYTLADISPGLTADFTLEVTAEKMALFYELTGDCSPIHMDEAYAQRRGYPGRVVYGMLGASLFSTLAGVYLPGEHCLLHGVECKFARPVFIGDVLTVSGTVTEVNETFREITVKAVITKSFERIHRSNLIGMGVLPLNFADKADYDRIAPLKDATFSILGLDNGIAPRQQVTLRVQPADAEAFDVPVIVRIDTPIEKEYYLAGGILQYVLTQILK